ncbi:enoyl-CoA hydratase/isomerase family protein [Ideonella sp. YS5]|uniref:enoyl-CoA hydratase/isomerase family protein n=1 Tax=Ideonella sp. YS5 TaxID=3453714 RepID=UPI003EEB1B7E
MTILARYEPAPGGAAGRVLHLTLNRPEVRNAMSLAMVGELRAALAAAEAEGDVRVVVLRGHGGHFCAGGDIKDMAAAHASPDGRAAMAEANARFGQLCTAFAATGLATIAVVEGTVMGGGFGLACVADVVLAAESARFRLPETSLGLVPAQIAPFLVERLGVAETRRLAVTGGELDAHEALGLRLAHEVHPADGLDAALHRVLGQVLRCAPQAVAATKALIARARLQPAASLVAAAADVFAGAVLGPEGIEGTAAFVRKRRPAWAPA